ncbi:MAG TPA: alpha/beta hydrolase-fold protein [Bacteroidales bacterium]|nr:hypothetical protein [Bacteroidales bacterium]HQG53774.1 alpha/beta hydrolase-fold protein [Bacteroidales bacterium]HQJ21474.1 alpha/beta hydrolase-fold protein [Bacteroidales bacterium]HRC89576.1 alpha/beta hydrolase-fold protein [Bacteroidales bacterium]
MMKNFSFLIIVIISIFSIINVTPSYAQKLKPGPQDLCFFSKVDETDQPYAVYVPRNYEESKKYPLVIFLHGAMSNHRLGLRRVFGEGNIQGLDFIKPGNVPVETDLEATRYWPELKDVPYVVAAPYARGTAGYQGIPEEDVYQMLDDIKSRFSIDEDRIYLTGLSMGGGGTIWLGLTRPEVWAAIAPCCPAPPAESAELACNVSNLPVHLFVGDKDFLYKTALEWKTKFETYSPMVNYVEYPGVGHNSWEWAYKDGFIFEWFSQFKRNLFPEQVRFATRWFKYNKAYWVKFDNITPGTLATIDAKFTAQNTIDVTTNSLEAFTLSLEGHPLFNSARKVIIKVDGKSFSLQTGNAASFTKTAKGWVNTKFTPSLTSKKQGAEGPLYAAVSSNHVYVYGTGGNPSQEELSARRAQAAAAADWAADRGMMGRIMIFPRVLSDKEVRQSDFETSNLILFGTRETNAIIEKFADKLPIHLKNDAVKDYGLVYIFPMNDHYFLVNSGLAWWTPPKKSEQPTGYNFMNLKAEILKNYKDFILFRESPDNIVSHGYFDNLWKLPQDAADAMKVTGVIEIK